MARASRLFPGRWRHGLPPLPRGAASALAGGWLAPAALVVVEEAADAGFTAPAGFLEEERRRYDDTELIFLRAEV